MLLAWEVYSALWLCSQKGGAGGVNDISPTLCVGSAPEPLLLCLGSQPEVPFPVVTCLLVLSVGTPGPDLPVSVFSTPEHFGSLKLMEDEYRRCNAQFLHLKPEARALPGSVMGLVLVDALIICKHFTHLLYKDLLRICHVLGTVPGSADTVEKIFIL